jgi:3-carboxy-cis,cis-muconate cycloisomerase
MPVSAIDSLLFKNLFGTQAIRDVFDDKNYIQQCVHVEAALARAQTKVGVIPQHVANTIANTCATVQLDYNRLANETHVVGYPILPLVRQLAVACGDEAGGYVHWGATTQDIQDTATVVQMREGLDIVDRQLRQLAISLETLCQKHRDTAMAGRTHLQHALPVTFGYKCAVYLSSIQRHLERLQQLKPRCLLVQFGGAAGTLASLGSDNDTGLEVRAALAEQLGLYNPSITWHSARDGIAEIINFLALVGGTLGKIATDIIFLSSNEVSEVSEPFVPHRGASSTMPQKRNPISSEVILAASKILRSNAGLCLDAMITDFERATGPWHLEWLAIPESFVIAVGALAQADFALSGLVVNTSNMRRNLDSTRGLIVAEAVMMALAPHLGRLKAHDMIYEACKQTIGDEATLCDTLMLNRQVTDVLSAEHLQELCEPGNYLGAAKIMVDSVLAMRY